MLAKLRRGPEASADPPHPRNDVVHRYRSRSVAGRLDDGLALDRVGILHELRDGIDGSDRDVRLLEMRDVLGEGAAGNELADDRVEFVAVGHPGVVRDELLGCLQLRTADRVEDAFSTIRAELDYAMATATGFEPYVKAAANRPPSTQGGLAGNDAWSAFFLIKDGEVTAGGQHCPATLAALDGAPLARIPNHSPLVLFSKLAGGAHIPAHTGMINTRLICHLPLIAPVGCHFRVGNELRTWENGKAWVFDDTIEHEAWNRSSEDRTILLFDIWRPDLTPDEREAFTALCVAIEKYSPDQDWH